MASINRSDSLAHLRPQEQPSKAPGLWGSPSSQSIHTLRNSSTTGRLSSASGQFKQSKSGGRLDSSDDESLSSDENDLYQRTNLRPSTPPKPNIFRQLRRSSTTTTTNLFCTSGTNLAGNPAQSGGSGANTPLLLGTLGKQDGKSTRKTWSNNFELRPAKSEYNLNFMGREHSHGHGHTPSSNAQSGHQLTPIGLQKSQTNSPSSGFWSNPGAPGQSQPHHLQTGSFMSEDKTFDLVGSNPSTVPLTAELFQHIVDELNQLATYAKKVYHRSSAAENQPLCRLLEEGVSKAYVNLSTIVQPAQPAGGSQLGSPAGSGSDHQSSGRSICRETSALHLSRSDEHRPTDALQQLHQLGDHQSDTHSLLNGVHQASSNSLTSDSASSLPQDSLAMNLLQQYSERLLSMVEQRFSGTGPK